MLITNSKGPYHTFLILLGVPFDPLAVRVGAERLALTFNLSGILCWYCSSWCLIRFVSTASKGGDEFLYLIFPWGRNTMVKGAAVYTEEVSNSIEAAENQLYLLFDIFFPSIRPWIPVPVIDDPFFLESLTLMMGDPETDFSKLKKLWSIVRSQYSGREGARSINCSIDTFPPYPT